MGEIAEHRQLIAKDVGGGAHGFLCIDRAVGFDIDHQLVEVGALFNTRSFHGVGNATHGRERRIQHQTTDGAGLFVRTTTRSSRLIAETALDLEAHVQRRVLGQMADHVVAVDDLDVVIGPDVCRSDRTRTLLGQRQRGAIATVHTNRHVFQVQQDVEHVFLQTFDRGVLVEHTVDLDLGDRKTGDRRQQHTTQGIAQRVPVTALRARSRPWHGCR